MLEVLTRFGALGAVVGEDEVGEVDWDLAEGWRRDSETASAGKRGNGMRVSLIALKVTGMDDDEGRLVEWREHRGKCGGIHGMLNEMKGMLGCQAYFQAGSQPPPRQPRYNDEIARYKRPNPHRHHVSSAYLIRRHRYGRIRRL